MNSKLNVLLGLWFECETEANVRIQNEDTPERVKPLKQSPSIFGILQGWILCHLLGIMLVLCPRSASVIGAKADLPSDDSVTLAILAGNIAGAFLVFQESKFSKFGQSWKLVKCVALLEFSALAFAMSLCNFSLAYIVVLFIAPVALIAKPSTKFSSISYFVRSFLVVCVHPLSLIFGFCILDTWRSFPEKSILDLFSSAISASKQAVMFSITDGYIYGNYSFVVGTVCLLPCWLLLWHVVNAKQTNE